MKKKNATENIIDIKKEYIKLMDELLEKKNIKINKKICDVITYLYDNNDKDKFIILLNDLYESFDDDKNKEHIENIISSSSLEDINKLSTYNLCPYKNKLILDTVIKKEEGKNIEYNNFTTDYVCRKCKGSKTISRFVHKRLGLDEMTDTVATCVNCGYSWKI
jgi:DNA-directed RNA polymerase subunit M/transcription elongation factor TFIIS